MNVGSVEKKEKTERALAASQFLLLYTQAVPKCTDFTALKGCIPGKAMSAEACSNPQLIKAAMSLKWTSREFASGADFTGLRIYSNMALTMLKKGISIQLSKAKN